MMKRKNGKLSRGLLSKVSICIFLEATSHSPGATAFHAVLIRRDSILIRPLNNLSQSSSSSIEREGEGADDESFLLSQALNPNKNSRGGDSESNSDPILSMLASTNKNNIQQQWQSQGNIPWYDKVPSDQSLPFDCTGCGKCCQTKGEVYLNPNETKQAAAVLNISIDKFKDEYTSRDVTGEKIKDSWTVLKQKKDSEGIEGCIFLEEGTKMCSIYEARPLQCSTYPFWPRIMESIDSWNDEVVINDGKAASERVWTPAGGGCEGMKEIKLDSEDTLVVIQSGDGKKDDEVSMDDALGRLQSYTRYKRAFPI